MLDLPIPAIDILGPMRAAEIAFAAMSAPELEGISR